MQGAFMQKSSKIIFAIAFTTLSATTYAQMSEPSTPSSGAPAAGSSAYGGNASGTNDPFIQKREADAAARAQYKSDQAAAKQKYEAEKRESAAELKATRPQTNTPDTSGPSQ
jgi:hypothetical protein